MGRGSILLLMLLRFSALLHVWPQKLTICGRLVVITGDNQSLNIIAGMTTKIFTHVEGV